MKITPELLLQLGFELEEKTDFKKEHGNKNLNVYSIIFENITDLKYDEWGCPDTSISLKISFFIIPEKITLYVGDYYCKHVQSIEEALQFICETSIKFGKKEKVREFKTLLEL